MTEKEIFEACSQLEEQGKAPSVRLVRGHLGRGSTNDIVRGVRRWKAGRAAGEAPEPRDEGPPPPAATAESAAAIQLLQQPLEELVNKVDDLAKQLAKQDAKVDALADRMASVEKRLDALPGTAGALTRHALREDITRAAIQLESRLGGKSEKHVQRYRFHAVPATPPAPDPQRNAAR